MEIFVRKNGQGTGPYSLAQLRAALASQEITLDDQAWHRGLSGWQPLKTVLEAAEPRAKSLAVSAPPQPKAGPWEVLCPQCVVVIATPSTLPCPNCGGRFALEGGFATCLKCVRCSHRVASVRCGDCGSVASGEYIRKTFTAARTLGNAADEASAAVCPACGCAHTNKLRDTGCASTFWFLVSIPFLLIPYFIYAAAARYRLPNTKCLGCGHTWNAKVNRG